MVKEKTTKKVKLLDADLKTKEALQVKLNRLYAKRTALENKLKTRAKSERMQRTRTMIQLGGLVAKSGLVELCDIHEGDDLQIDIPSLDKAATLLGILHETMNKLTELSDKNSEESAATITSKQMDKFKRVGKRLLKG